MIAIHWSEWREFLYSTTTGCDGVKPVGQVVSDMK